jgi:hypothetical protein
LTAAIARAKPITSNSGHPTGNRSSSAKLTETKSMKESLFYHSKGAEEGSEGPWRKKERKT